MIRLGGRRLARHAALNLLGQGIPLLAALPAIPLLIDGAGAERFGLLTIVWVLIGYVSLFDFGVGRALTHAVAERMGRGAEGEVRAVVRMGVGVAAALSLATGLLVFLAAPFVVSPLQLEPELSNEVVGAVRIVGLAVPSVVLAAVLRGVLEGLRRFGVVNAIRMPMGVATFLAPLVVLPWSSHLAALVGALLLTRILGLAGYGWAVRRALSGPAFGPGPRAVASAEGRRALLRYGGWATVSNLVGPLMVHFDRVAIGALLTASAVAFYTTPFEIVHRLLLIPTAVVAAFFPAFAQTAGAGHGGAPRLFRGSVRGILLLVFPPALLLFAFADEGLTLWVGPEFATEGAAVVRWLLVGMTANAVAHVPFVLLQGVGRPDVTAKLHLLEVPLYALALIWALPRYGITGAAVVWAARALVDLALLLVASARLLPETAPEALRAAALLAPVLGILALPLALSGPLARATLVAGITLGAVLAGLQWARGERAVTGGEMSPRSPTLFR